jgi:hypothetical protein
MGERTQPSASTTAWDIPLFLWRVLASSKTASVLLVLLAFVVWLTLLFSPQHPGPGASADELARWASGAQARYGSWYDTFLTLKVFDVGASAWFRLLLGFGALSLAVSLADGAAKVVRAWRQPDVQRPESFFQAAPSPGEWYASQKRTDLLEELAQRLAWPAWLPWRRLQMAPCRAEAGQASYLFQDWLTWRRAALLLVHLGILLILAGLALDARLGWRQDGVMLMPGQSASLPGQPGFSLHLEGVDGAERVGKTASRVTLDTPNGSIREGTVALGQPYTAHGLTIYQRDVGPILRLSARGQDGTVTGSGGTFIPVQDASTEMEPADEVRLVFTESRLEQYVIMPYIQKVIRLVLYRQGERWDLYRDELQIEVYTGNADTPEVDGSIVGSGTMKLSDIAYELTWEQYAVLDIVHSSWQWLVRVGMGLGLMGLIAVFLIPSARLWVRIVEDRETSVVELAGEMPDSSGLLDAWLTDWRRRLGGGEAGG